ncbi:MAG: hypothetical protein ACE3L7_02265 [Candidatus Pristimantibacillus sp.]
MKITKKTVVFGLIVGMLIGGATVSSADSIMKEIKAKIDYGFTYVVNGKSFAPKDGAKNELKPILYNGTYYVPAKALADSLNVPFSLDSKKKQLSFGVRATSTDLIKEKLFQKNQADKYVYTSVDPTALTIGSNTFKSGLIFLPYNEYQKKSFDFDTDKKFSTVTFKATIDESGINYKLIVKDQENTVLKEAIINSSEITSLQANVTGVTKLTFEILHETGNFKPVKIIVGDIQAK